MATSSAETIVLIQTKRKPNTDIYTVDAIIAKTNSDKRTKLRVGVAQTETARNKMAEMAKQKFISKGVKASNIKIKHGHTFI